MPQGCSDAKIRRPRVTSDSGRARPVRLYGREAPRQGACHPRGRANQVPLGSVTYYFATLEDLLTAAFLQLAADSSTPFRTRLEAATDRAEACTAVADIIADQIWAEPRTLLLSYELYAFAARHPPISAVMQNWMDSSRGALGRFFDPLTARALDVLIEGIGIHNSIDRAPLERDAIKTIVERIAGC
jgi:DNA-binding transcriptional regulator YbjK